MFEGFTLNDCYHVNNNNIGVVDVAAFVSSFFHFVYVVHFGGPRHEARNGSFPFVSQPHGSESDYQNVEFLTFINPEHVIYDIGTEIRIFHCFATKMLKSFCKSIIFSGIESSRRDLAFYSIKTRFKALFKN